MKKIKLAVAGVGNCASSLIQGIEFYRRQTLTNGKHIPLGLMNEVIGGYRPQDIEVVCAFDVDKRKVGRPVKKAIFSEPNCTQLITNHLPAPNALVQMGPVLDGVADHMKDYPEARRFILASEKPVDVVKTLKRSGAEVLISYLPVGSTKAVHFYAQAALDAGCAFINCIPVFIASDPVWAKRFASRACR